MKVLILGLGRMGDRYAQALPKVANCSVNLYTVDPAKQYQYSTEHYGSLDDVPAIEFDLAIDARPNVNRLKTLKALLDRHVPKIVIEKPTAQSLSESQKMIEVVEERSSHIMVPFYRRYSYLFDPTVLGNINAGSLRCINTTAGAIGLGCNGVHLLDAANYLFDETPKSVFAQIQEDSIPSPRGVQFKDHGGTLTVNYSNNRRCILTILPCSSAGSSTQFYFERGKVILHEQKSSDWYWYSTPEESSNLPIYITHTDQPVQTPIPYNLDLMELIERGLRAFLETPESVPNLKNAHVTLTTIALSIQSSRGGTLIKYEDARQLPDIKFNFT